MILAEVKPIASFFVSSFLQKYIPEEYRRLQVHPATTTSASFYYYHRFYPMLLLN